MARLEDLSRGAQVAGVLPDGLVTVVDVKWYGSTAVELTYKDAAGRLGNQLLYRDHEPGPALVTAGQSWSVDADGARLRLAHLFDPLLAGLMDADVQITLEIRADIPGGAPAHVVRTVTENCRTLGFEVSGFEEE